MLVEIAIGDAYGRPFEFEKNVHLMVNDCLNYKTRPSERKTSKGIYTDDTQMTIAVAEQILYGTSNTQEEFSKFFLKVWKRDPRAGYSRRIETALISARNTMNNHRNLYRDYGKSSVRPVLSLKTPLGMGAKAFLELAASSANSNGCMMRVLPIGLLPDPQDVIKRTFTQTIVTHGSEDAYLASAATSLTAHFFYYHSKPGYTEKELYRAWKTWIVRYLGIHNVMKVLDASVWNEMPCDALATAGTCIKLSLSADTMSYAMEKAISIKGDVDSIAAVTLGLCELRKVKNDLSPILYRTLENGKYGGKYLNELSKQLYEKFPRNRRVLFSD